MMMMMMLMMIMMMVVLVTTAYPRGRSVNSMRASIAVVVMLIVKLAVASVILSCAVVIIAIREVALLVARFHNFYICVMR